MLFLLSQVGDQDEKLAEGIKLYAISATATSKRTILSDLITVNNLSSLFVIVFSISLYFCCKLKLPMKISFIFNKFSSSFMSLFSGEEHENSFSIGIVTSKDKNLLLHSFCGNAFACFEFLHKISPSPYHIGSCFYQM